MCGIFGWSFKRKSGLPLGKRESLAGTLAVANSYRGDQSWGVYMMNEGKPKVVKAVGDLAKVQGTSTWGSRHTVMAHTRFATVGSISPRNAHPFKVGNITLAHNGAIFNHMDLDKKYERKTEVDSEHLAFHLAEGRSFSDLEGYGAIEWVEDSDPSWVYIARLRLGSLSAYGIKRGSEQVGVVWSSDEDHLKAALGASRLECFPYQKLQEGQIYRAEQGELFVCSSREKLDLASPSWGQYTESSFWTSGGSVTSGTGRRRIGYNECEICKHWHSEGTLCYRHGCKCDGSVLPVEESEIVGEEKPVEPELTHLGGDQWMDEAGNILIINDPERVAELMAKHDLEQLSAQEKIQLGE